MKSFKNFLFLISVFILSVIFFNGCDGMADKLSSLDSANQNKNLILLRTLFSQGDIGPGSSTGDPGSPLMGWQLNETNTGLAGAGINGNDLPEYPHTGNWIYPAYGTVIREKKITDNLILVNGNITLERCLIQPTWSGHMGGIVFDHLPGESYSHYPNYLIDCDIDGSKVTDPAIYSDCAVRGAITVQRCNIWGMGSGIGVFGWDPNVNTLIEQNYVHDLRAGNGSHNESATVRVFAGNSCIFRNNRFVCVTGSDSGAIFMQAYSGFYNHVLIQGNLLYTGNYDLVLMGYGENTYGNDIRARNNRFVKYGYGPVWVSSGPGFAEWTENYYDDPSDPDDHKGTIINEP